MKYFLQVFGCQMNLSDAERLRTVLERSGYTATANENNADLIAVVACAVRQSPVDRIYGRARRWQEWKKNKPLITVLTGCVLNYDQKKLTGVFDYLFPITDLDAFALTLAGQTPAHQDGGNPADYFFTPPKHTSVFQAYVPISIGCNKFCSYCAVPYTRGRETSRDPKDIINEISELIRAGYKEITLLGQNVNSYGNDFEGVALNLPGRTVHKYQRGHDGQLEIAKRSVSQPMNFPCLLQTIAQLPGQFWLRFITSHPYDLSDELISVIAQEKKVTPYLHLPIQSGSDRVLRRMNRLYSIEQYRERVKKIRSLIPAVVLTTDIIVGFPGETADDFQKTCLAVQEFNYDLAYIAQYSPRPGTKSAEFRDDVPRFEKKKREQKVNDILRQVAAQQNLRLVNTESEVLFDRYKNGFAYGKTFSGKNIRVKSAHNLAGTFRNVLITKTTAWHLEGTLHD